MLKSNTTHAPGEYFTLVSLGVIFRVNEVNGEIVKYLKLI